MLQLSSIKTSSENKTIITDLTRKLGLGSENIIARIALGYSLSKDRKLKLSEIKDSRGKEYSKSVLFGSYYSLYVSLISVHYNLHIDDRDIAKYIKLHIDDGLKLINTEYFNNPGLSGTDFLITKIEEGLNLA